MAESTLLFCQYVNWPSLPRCKPEMLLNSTNAIEATRAEQHEDKGIIHFPPFTKQDGPVASFVAFLADELSSRTASHCNGSFLLSKRTECVMTRQRRRYLRGN